MAEIKRLKPLYLETPLARGSTVIVEPRSEWGKRAARQFAEELQTRCGVALPVVSEEKVDGPEIGRKHRIALGSMADNRLIEQLYCRRYTKVDLEYPGEGGRVVQTVHNPEGEGVNVVVLGGSGQQGVEDAARCALDYIERKDGVCFLPRILDVKLGRCYDDYQPQIQDYGGADSPPCFIAKQCGDIALALGSRAYEEQFRDAMMKGAETQAFSHFALWYVVPYFDLLEESPVFNDEQRLAVTNYFVDLLRSDEGVNFRWFRRGLKGPSLRHNHQTHAALGIHYAAQYLQKYYRFDPAKVWLGEAHELFSTFLDGFERPPCDDSGLQLATLKQAFWYLLDLFGPQAAECAMVKKSVERMIHWTDNSGVMPPVGDGTPGNDAADIFRWGEYLLRDPRCRFLLDRLAEHRDTTKKPSPVPHLFTCEKVQPQVPEHSGGAVITPMDRVFYDTFAAETSPKRPNVPFEKTFDKIAFRAGWSRDDDYLLFDGISYGGHDYDDGNTILQFSALDCVFITGLDYLLPRVSDHNAITVTRNGVSTVYPPFPELLWVHNTDWGAASRTCLRNYAGVDWYRTLIWLRNRFTIVVDELAAREDGEYLFRKHWRLIGEVEHDGRRLLTTQERLGIRRRFVLETSYGNGMRVERDSLENLSRSDKYAGANKYYDGRSTSRSEAYWANPPRHIHITQEAVRQKMHRGESFFLATLFYPVREDEKLTLSEIRPGVYALSRDETEALVLCRSADRDYVSLAGETLACDAAFLAGGDATIFTPDKAESTAMKLPAPEGTSEKVTENNSYVAAPSAHVSKSATFDATITAVCAGKGKDVAACIGCADGTLVLVDPSLTPVSRHRVEGEINDLCLLNHPQEGLCILVAAGNYLRCLRRDGKELWNYTTPYEKKQYSIWRFESSRALTTLVADVNGDGVPEVVHASGSSVLALLSADGKELWRCNTVFPHTTIALGAWKDEEGLCVLSGCGHMSPWADILIHNTAGEQVDRIYIDPWVCRLDSLWTCDLDGDGNGEILAGTEVGTLALLRPAESKKECVDLVPWDAGVETIRPVWRITLGDCVTALAVVDMPAGKGIIAGSINEHLVCVDPGGKLKWHCDIGGGVICLAAGAKSLCAGTDDGRAVLVDFSGRLLAEKQVAAIPRSDPKRLCNPRVRARVLPDGQFFVTGAGKAMIIREK